MASYIIMYSKCMCYTNGTLWFYVCHKDTFIINKQRWTNPTVQPYEMYNSYVRSTFTKILSCINHQNCLKSITLDKMIKYTVLALSRYFKCGKNMTFQCDMLAFVDDIVFQMLQFVKVYF